MSRDCPWDTAVRGPRGEVGAGGLSPRRLQWPHAPERLARARGRRVAPQRRRADQGRPRHRQRRARPAEHVRRSARRRVELDGEPLAKQQLAYVLLHKPAGVVTTARDPQGRPTVVGLVGHPARVVPVGRLDADTTGVMLLTNDGELAHRLAHPRYEVDKVYVAELEGSRPTASLRTLDEGVKLDDGARPRRPRRAASAAAASS